MEITAIVCTYNRCDILARALESIAASSFPSSVTWEVVVVDNNSKDPTPEVIADFVRRYPGRFRYVAEPQQGLSYARNTGIREAYGKVLAFTDDDVSVDPSWLWRVSAGLLSGEWAGAGGRVLPVWSCALPSWLSPEEPRSLAPFVFFDHGPDAGPLEEPPFGANMAFRKDMFEKYGGFRTDLGRCADDLISNEDTEFGRRLLAGGERLRYEPSAVVNHPVSESRVQKTYMLAWWFGKGRADIRELGFAPAAKWFVNGVPVYMFRRLAVSVFRWMITVRPRRRFSRKLDVWAVAGAILECYEQRHHPRAESRSALDVRTDDSGKQKVYGSRPTS